MMASSIVQMVCILFFLSTDVVNCKKMDNIQLEMILSKSNLQLCVNSECVKIDAKQQKKHFNSRFLNLMNKIYFFLQHNHLKNGSGSRNKKSMMMMISYSMIIILFISLSANDVRQK